MDKLLQHFNIVSSKEAPKTGRSKPFHTVSLLIL